jgi:hypothetical protein
METFGLTPFTFVLAIVVGIIVSFTIIALTAPIGAEHEIPITIHQQEPLPQAPQLPAQHQINSDVMGAFEIFGTLAKIILLLSVLGIIFMLLHMVSGAV